MDNDDSLHLYSLLVQALRPHEGFGTNENACFAKGYALLNLGHHLGYGGAAIAEAPDHKPNRSSYSLFDLIETEAVIAAYNQVLSINPDDNSTERPCERIKAGAQEQILKDSKDFTETPSQCLPKRALQHPSRDKNLFKDLFSAGHYEEALIAYSEAFDSHSDDPDALYNTVLYNRGNLLHESARYEDAIAAYDQALEMQPNDHAALNNKGYALDDLGRYEEAIAAYNRAIAIKPDKYEALYNKGYALFQLGRYEEAIAVYHQVLTLRPMHYKALYNTACSYIKLNRIGNALMSLESALELDDTAESLKMAQTDSDLDAIRHRPQFQALIHSFAASKAKKSAYTPAA